MGSTLYLECNSGISGDMFVAALLDLGASEQRLGEVLASLPMGGFTTHVSRVSKSGLDACDFDVRLDKEHENHDHDMAYLFGHLACEGGVAGPGVDGRAGEHEHGGHHHHEHVHEHDGAHEHGEAHEHEHGHHGGAHGHHHEHRTLADVMAIVDAAQMSKRAHEIAARIFEWIAKGEAKAHGTTVDKVHFHEVGAVDSIVDVVSAAVCLDDLGVSEVVIPELAEGRGTIRCAHGIMPIPVPAVANIVGEAGITLRMTGVEGELVTPTGAAIAAAVRTSDRLPERFVVKAVGLGAGKRSYRGCTGVLRAMLIEPAENKDVLADRGAAPDMQTAGAGTTHAQGESSPDASVVMKLETDVDDCTGEALGYVIERLMAAGAREAHAIPLVTKKGRPGFQLQVICDEPDVERLESVIFATTTTIGIRRQRMERTCLAREEVAVRTAYGEIAGKRVTLPDGSARTYPEHDAVRRACEQAGVGYQDAIQAFYAAVRE